MNLQILNLRARRLAPLTLFYAALPAVPITKSNKIKQNASHSTKPASHSTFPLDIFTLTRHGLWPLEEEPDDSTCVDASPNKEREGMLEHETSKTSRFHTAPNFSNNFPTFIQLFVLGLALTFSLRKRD